MRMVEWPLPLARRIRRYRITDHGLAMLFEKGQVWGIREGIPEGARAAGLAFERELSCVVLFVEHPSFPYIEDGNAVPEGRLTFADVNEDMKAWKDA